MILFPHAKINIGLNILGKREDGYHNISSVFYPVSSCADILEITEKEHFLFESSGVDIPKEENLCEKAFSLLRKDFSFPNVHIHLHKQIPIGAGLGGGSADAAFLILLVFPIIFVCLCSVLASLFVSSSCCPIFIFACGKSII